MPEVNKNQFISSEKGTDRIPFVKPRFSLNILWHMNWNISCFKNKNVSGYTHIFVSYPYMHKMQFVNIMYKFLISYNVHNSSLYAGDCRPRHHQMARKQFFIADEYRRQEKKHPKHCFKSDWATHSVCVVLIYNADSKI